jgi:hypothetical protein
MMDNNVGTATVKIEADTDEFEQTMDRLGRKYGKRVTWPEASLFASSLGFVGYLIHVIWG